MIHFDQVRSLAMIHESHDRLCYCMDADDWTRGIAVRPPTEEAGTGLLIGQELHGREAVSNEAVQNHLRWCSSNEAMHESRDGSLECRKNLKLHATAPNMSGAVVWSFGFERLGAHMSGSWYRFQAAPWLPRCHKVSRPKWACSAFEAVESGGGSGKYPI